MATAAELTDEYAGPVGQLHLYNGVCLKLGRRSPLNPRVVEYFEAGTPEGARKVAPVAAHYDCFGMVIANRRGVPYSFKDDDVAGFQAQAIEERWDDFTHQLEMDGYRAKATGPEVGNIVTYKLGETTVHIGIVVQVGIDSVLVLSKWGPFGEYVHNVDLVRTEYGTPDKYWEWNPNG